MGNGPPQHVPCGPPRAPVRLRAALTWRTQLKPKLGCMSSTSRSRSSSVRTSPSKRSRRSMYCTCVGEAAGRTWGRRQRPRPCRSGAGPRVPSRPPPCRRGAWLGAPGPGSRRRRAGSRTPGRACGAGPGSPRGTARPPGRGRGVCGGAAGEAGRLPSPQPKSRAHLLEATREGPVLQHTQSPDVLRGQQVVEGAQPLAQLHIEAPVADGPGDQSVSCPLVTRRHHVQVPRAVLTTGMEGRDGGRRAPPQCPSTHLPLACPCPHHPPSVRPCPPWLGGRTNLFHPSQDDVCTPPVVQGDLQAYPQRPVGRGCL